LGESERKNLFQLARNAVGVNYHQLHHFLTEAPWSDSKIKDTKLRLVKHVESKGEPKKGDRSKSIYATGNIKVQVDYVVTDICDPKDQECEVTSYAATITVKRGSSQQVVKAVGSSGCKKSNCDLKSV
jgi:hypothetical protein